MKFYQEFLLKARPKQRLPSLVSLGQKTRWLFLAGRGTGKTWTFSHQTILYCLKYPGSNFGVIGPTHDDVESVCFMDDEAGIYSIIPDALCMYGDKQKAFNKSKLILKLANGSTIRGFSAQKPRKLRGKNLAACWLDEWCFYEYPVETLTQAELATRKGKHRVFFISTTPRPIAALKEMVKDSRTFMTRASTYENAENLSPDALEDFIRRYEGTNIGRQEIYAEILENVGSLFRAEFIEDNRIKQEDVKKIDMKKVCIGFDPAVTSNPDSDLSGIVTVGQDHHGHYYVLRDDTFKGTPEECASKVVELYHSMEANYITVEINNGGDYLRSMIYAVDKTVVVKDVRATRGKALRAEPISVLYQQNKVHHAGPGLGQLEDQMCNWTGDKNDPSPDRMDALVYAIASMNSTGSGQARWRVH